MSETSERYKTLRAQLSAKFPSTFTASSSAAKWPLSSTILSELIEACPDIPVSSLRMFVLFYMRGSRYLAALKTGAPRVNLRGNYRGYVTSFMEERAQAEASATRAFKAQRLLEAKETENV